MHTLRKIFRTTIITSVSVVSLAAFAECPPPDIHPEACNGYGYGTYNGNTGSGSNTGSGNMGSGNTGRP